jgi:shikimate kinase
MILFLVGFMGCGKSTVGRKLAAAGGYNFVDLDGVVAEMAGASVQEIFATQGEEAFRKLERKAIEQLALQDRTIVATGGGAPCWGDNMKLLSEKGTTIYLKMSAKALAERLQHVRVPRPKVAGLGPEELYDYVAALLAEREPIYMQSRIVVDCDDTPSNAVAGRLRYLLK